MSVKMLADKVLIVPIYDPDKSASGLLYIPEQAKERVDQGIVHSVGPKCTTLQLGDLVTFPGYSGTQLYIEGEGTFIIMPENEITAILSGDEIDNTDVPGLYFRGKDGTYYQATVEFALHMMSQALKEAPWRAAQGVSKTI